MRYKTEKFKKIKTITESICDAHDNYEDILSSMCEYFTHISDSNSKRKEEFNEKYNIITLANSKSKTGLIKDFKNKDKLIIDYCFYNNNPNDIMIMLNVMENWEGNWIQKDISIFIDEN